MKAVFDRYREIIPHFSSFLQSLHQPFPVHLRVNRLKIEPGRLREILAGKGVYLDRSSARHDTFYMATARVKPGRLLEYFLGYFHPQAFTSALASLALGPPHNSFVLDMCASPGGKTSHLAQLMENTGLIVANEPYMDRHIALRNTLSRLGVLNAIVTAYRAEQFPLKQRFDYVLADVPCSGEGTFRFRDGSSRYKETSRRGKLPGLQKRILLRGFDLLKEEGKMLYCTCTYNPEENEGVVDFLLRERDAAVLPLDLGVEHAPGLCEWRGGRYDRAVQRAVRIYPHQVNSVGFFLARIGRRA